MSIIDTIQKYNDLEKKRDKVKAELNDLLKSISIKVKGRK